jgi:hypothetical protein
MVLMILHLLAIVIGLGALLLGLIAIKFLELSITLFPITTILCVLPLAYVIGVWAMSKVLKK